MHYFSTLFGKELYMFRKDLLSIIRNLNTVFTAVGIRHTSYVAVHGTSTVIKVLRLLMMDSKRAVPHACTTGWYAAMTLTTSLTTSIIES